MIVADPLSEGARNDVVMIPIDAITIPKFRPVRPEETNSTEYIDLRESIKNGIQIEPIVVRPAGNRPEANTYELIVGVRRFRVIRDLEKKQICARVISATDEEVVIYSITENKERKEDDPITLAQGFKQLLDAFHYTQEKLAERFRMDQSSIANTVRLLGLPFEIQHYLALNNDSLTASHGLQLLRIKDDPKLQMQLAEKTIANELSTRNLRDMIDDIINTSPARVTFSLQQLQGLEEAERACMAVQIECFGCKKTFRMDQTYYTIGDITTGVHDYCPACAPDAHIAYEKEKKRLEEEHECKASLKRKQKTIHSQKKESEELERAKVCERIRALVQEQGCPECKDKYCRVHLRLLH